MEILLTVVATAFVCISCFIVGAKVGQTVAKGEKITVPSVNPMEAVRTHKAKKYAEMEQNRMDTILRNIDRYDGTSAHQEDVPRG